MINVTFWGVRGSIPSPITNDELKAKLIEVLSKATENDIGSQEAATAFLDQLPFTSRRTYGGNTSCIELKAPEGVIILDAGSGLRCLGRKMMDEGRGEGVYIPILLTHFHWDHILGFPFFAPAFRAGNRIEIHSSDSASHRHFRLQQSFPFFPVDLDFMAADISFEFFPPNSERVILGAECRSSMLNHPGGSQAYRITTPDGASVAYCTDAELAEAPTEVLLRYAEFVQGADLVIADTQYDFQEAYIKMNWGHSSSLRVVDLLHDANVDTLCMFHYDPDCSDDKVNELLARTRQYVRLTYPGSKLHVIAAHEGLQLRIGGADERVTIMSS